MRSLSLASIGEKSGVQSHFTIFSLLIMMNASTHYFCAHSFRRGWWVTSFVVASGSAADATDAGRVPLPEKKVGYCLFGLAER